MLSLERCALVKKYLRDTNHSSTMKNRPFGKHGFHCSEINLRAWVIGGK